jgi:hypothetical protein
MPAITIERQQEQKLKDWAGTTISTALIIRDEAKLLSLATAERKDYLLVETVKVSAAIWEQAEAACQGVSSRFELIFTQMVLRWACNQTTSGRNA